MNRIAILGVFALACNGADEKTESGHTGTSPTDTEECADGIYDGPTLIQVAQVSCVDTSTVRFYVETDGWTGDGTIFSQETGNPDTPYDQYADEHDLNSYEFDPCGFWDHLENEITTGVAFGKDTPNQSTVFSCEPNVHYDGSGVMTYAAAVYDIDGNFADCLVWGHDPQGLIDGTYSRLTDPSFAGELANCEIGVATR